MGPRDDPPPEKFKDWILDELTSSTAPPCAFCFNRIDSTARSICSRCHAVYHRDCWKANDSRCAVYGCLPPHLPKEPPIRRPAPIGMWVVLLAFVTLILLGIPLIVSPPPMHEPPFGLRVYARAQGEFRSRARAGEGRTSYWRGDISGLYAMTGSDGQPLRLISLAGALADDRPLGLLAGFGPRAPSHGYWFRAIRHADELEPDPDRFAACAFPATYPVTGLNTFIISERHAVYKKDLGHGRGVEVFPTDPEKEGWRRQE